MDATNIQRTTTVKASGPIVHCQSSWQYGASDPRRGCYRLKRLPYTHGEHVRRSIDSAGW
jgi:hypothetical protein